MKAHMGQRLVHGSIVVAVAFGPGRAHAEDRQRVEALIARNVAAVLVDGSAAFDATLRDDAVVVPERGARRQALYAADELDVEQKLGTLTLVVDAAHHVAWFHAPIDASFRTPIATGGAAKRRTSATLRVSGIAIDDHGWKLAAVMYARTIPDRELFDRASPNIKEPQPGEGPTGVHVTGDPNVVRTIAAWFTPANPPVGSLASGQTKGSQVVASGTAPAELAVGPAVGKLVTAWDRLHIWYDTIDATIWNGTIGFARVELGLPVKARGATRMVLGAILVKEDTRPGFSDTWRWVSLNVAPL